MRGVRVLAVFAAAALAALAMTAGPASSIPPPESATVTKDLLCSINLGGYVAITSDVTLEVDSASGNTTLKCNFKKDEALTPPPDGTLHFAGFLCGTLVDLTTDSMATITKSGNATLTCQIKQNAA